MTIDLAAWWLHPSFSQRALPALPGSAWCKFHGWTCSKSRRPHACPEAQVPCMIVCARGAQYLLLQRLQRVCQGRGKETSSTVVHCEAERSGGAQHIPVLLQDTLQAFSSLQIGTYLDCTLGAGGHALAVAEQHRELACLIGLDVDPAAHQIAQQRLQAEADQHGFQFHPVHGNFTDLSALVADLPLAAATEGVDAILMDVGVSSMQLDSAERGFSFSQDGPLDMRMGPSARLSAAAIVNTWPEHELARIFRDYGEDKGWKRMAKRVAEARQGRTIESTHGLLAALKLPVVWHGRTKDGRRQIHPATRFFQGLRIAVNEELSALKSAIPQAISLLKPGGRLAVISFHSLEDRITKREFLAAAGQTQQSAPDEMDLQAFLEHKPPPAIVDIVTRKPITASDAELAENPRSRSAKLRIAQKL